ncbi:MAG: hypothetical protein ACREB8_00435 [Pseudolabrys sp.]
MISVVNGYVCTSSCDAASARAGKDPNAPPGTQPGQSDKSDKASAFGSQPATLLDGALKGTVSTDAATPADGAQPSQRPAIDILA